MGKLKDKYIEKMQEEYIKDIPGFEGTLDALNKINCEKKEFNNETAIGVAVKSLVSKYSNDQELGNHIRTLVNSFE